MAYSSRIRRLRSDIEAFIREKLLDSRLRGNDEKSSAAVINALTLGSKQLLFPESWLMFQRTGTSHLIAISGLHVSLVVAISYFIFNGLLRFIFKIFGRANLVVCREVFFAFMAVFTVIGALFF